MRAARCRRSSSCRRCGASISTAGRTLWTCTSAGSAGSSGPRSSRRCEGRATGSMWLDRVEWPVRRLHWLDVGWALFSLANLGGMLLFGTWETVPFHFIWVSLTIVYGFRVWTLRPTIWTLAAVMATTGAFIYIDYVRGAQPIHEITEVPLMAAMFLAMVWHARRRLAATREIRLMYEANARLLEREQRFIQDASHELRTPITVA